MLARDAGVAEVPDYEWNPLMDIDQAAVALTSKTKAEALKLAIDGGMIDEDNGRKALDGDPTFGATGRCTRRGCQSRSCRPCRITRRRISNAPSNPARSGQAVKDEKAYEAALRQAYLDPIFARLRGRLELAQSAGSCRAYPCRKLARPGSQCARRATRGNR